MQTIPTSVSCNWSVLWLLTPRMHRKKTDELAKAWDKRHVSLPRMQDFYKCTIHRESLSLILVCMYGLRNTLLQTHIRRLVVKDFSTSPCVSDLQKKKYIFFLNAWPRCDQQYRISREWVTTQLAEGVVTCCDGRGPADAALAAARTRRDVTSRITAPVDNSGAVPTATTIPAQLFVQSSSASADGEGD